MDCHFIRKAVRVINFQPRNFHTSPLFKQWPVLKFQDKICLETILLLRKSVNSLTPSVLNTWFSFSSDQHNYETLRSRQGNLVKSSYRTNRYGKYPIIAIAVASWKKIQQNLKTHYWKIYPPITLKQLSGIFISNQTDDFYSLWNYIQSFS